MKRLIGAVLTASLCICAAPLAGCSTFTLLQPASSVELTASRSLYAAEAAFSGASLALEAAVDSGVLKGAAAGKARRVYQDAHTALLAARAAKAAGDMATAGAKAADVLRGAGEVQQIATTGAGFGAASF